MARASRSRESSIVHRVVAGITLINAIAASGCTLNRLANTEVREALRQYERSNSTDANAYASERRITAPAARKNPSSTADETRVQSGEIRTLRGYILSALQDNPDIKSAEELARAKSARVAQVTALTDPILSTKTLPEPVRTAEGDNPFILGVQQKLPVPGKLDRAGRMALEEARAALQHLQETRLRVIADVKRAYFRIYIIDKTMTITEANQDVLRGLIDVAQGQIATGRRPQEDVLRAQVELSNLESQLIELRQQRVTSAEMLNRVLNRYAGTPVEPCEDFQERLVDVRVEQLFRWAGQHNPALQRLTHEIERDRHALELARLAYWPDLTVGFEWMYMEPRRAFQPPPNPQTGMTPIVSRMSEDGSDNWAITAGINVPIWFEKIEGGIREARARLAATRHERTALENNVRFEIEDALARVHAQYELTAIFGRTIIPQAQQAYEVSRSGYSAGRSDFQFVIDNWQKWLVFQIQYHRALGELERSMADLEQAVGLSLDGMEKAP